MSNQLRRMQKRIGRMRTDKEESKTEQSEVLVRGAMRYKYEFRERQSWTWTHFEKESEEHETSPRGIPGVYELFGGAVRPMPLYKKIGCTILPLK